MEDNLGMGKAIQAVRKAGRRNPLMIVVGIMQLVVAGMLGYLILQGQNDVRKFPWSWEVTPQAAYQHAVLESFLGCVLLLIFAALLAFGIRNLTRGIRPHPRDVVLAQLADRLESKESNEKTSG